MIEVFCQEEQLIRKCIDRFANMLTIELPNITVLSDETSQMKVNGECYQNSPTDYMIILKVQENIGRMIQTLAHEMVHVKQYLKDDLTSHFTTDIPYNERWWEVEAYQKEREMVLELLEDVKQGKL
jgi:hypothetical protein